MNNWRVLTTTTLACVATASFALIETEGFDGPGMTFDNPFFQHNFQTVPGTSLFWEIIDWDFQSAPQSLFLAVAEDNITFDTDPGEFVQHAQIWVKSEYGYAEVTFNGLDGSNNVITDTLTFNQGVTGWHLAESHAGFAVVTDMQLIGYEGVFDDLQADAVPEPATMTLLGLGVAAIAARRKRKLA